MCESRLTVFDSLEDSPHGCEQRRIPTYCSALPNSEVMRYLGFQSLPALLHRPMRTGQTALERQLI
jgi:hypothetical protein